MITRITALVVRLLIIPIVFVSATSVHAASFLVDFNTNSGSLRPTGTWNEYAAPSNITGAAIVDSTGFAPTVGAVTLSVIGNITDNTENSGLAVYQPLNNSSRNPSWVAAVGQNGASGDNFYTNNAPNSLAHSFTITFGGLSAGASLSLDLLAARDSSLARGYFDYSLDGGNTWIGFTVVEYDGTPSTASGWNTHNTASQIFALQSEGFTNHRYMTMSGTLAPTETTLKVRTTDDTSANSVFSAMNAMRLTVVPEPSSAALVLLSALGLLSRRHR